MIMDEQKAQVQHLLKQAEAFDELVKELLLKSGVPNHVATMVFMNHAAGMAVQMTQLGPGAKESYLKVCSMHWDKMSELYMDFKDTDEYRDMLKEKDRGGQRG